MVLAAAGAYYFGTMNAPEPSTAPSPSAAPSASISPSLSPSPSASASAVINQVMLENIKASVVSKNTAALEGYMADNVAVTIEATECCGNLTAVKAINEIDYVLDAAPPWNFEANNPIAIALRQKNPTAFPESTIIGTSSDRKLIQFTLNPEKTKITKVYMAIDYKLHGI